MISRITGDHNVSVDVNSRWSLIAAIYMGVIGPAVFIVQPGFVQGLVEYFGFSEQQAGYVAAAEMWGMAATTLLMSFFHSRLNWRVLLAWSTLLVAAGNLVSLGTQSVAEFAVIRGITGVGSGVLVSLSFTVIGLTDKPDRNFGYLIMWVLTYGAAGFLLMPTAYALIGMKGVLVFFALFSLSALPFIRLLPVSGEEHRDINQDAVDVSGVMKLMAIAAMFVYFVAQGVMWAYLFLIGTNGGASEQTVANGLTLSQFLGIAGAFVAAMLGDRFGRISPLTLAILGSVASLLFLFDQFSAAIYTFAVCLFNFAWNLTHPFLLAAMASFDRAGKLVTDAVAAQMLGLAVGPALAASVLRPDDYSAVIWLGVFLFVMSLLLILPPLIRQRSASKIK